MSAPISWIVLLRLVNRTKDSVWVGEVPPPTRTMGSAEIGAGDLRPARGVNHDRHRSRPGGGSDDGPSHGMTRCVRRERPRPYLRTVQGAAGHSEPEAVVPASVA